MLCPQCQTENPATARFCMRCGHTLAPAAAQADQTGNPGATLPRALAPVVPVVPSAPDSQTTPSMPAPAPPYVPSPPGAVPPPPLPLGALPAGAHATASAPVPTAAPAAAPRRASTAQRVLLAVVASVVLLGLAGGGVYVYLAHQQDLRTGHWTRLAPTVPGQPTPTVPPGTFVFNNSLGGGVAYAPPSVAPVPITWSSYHDAQDGYTLDTPSNWQNINTPEQGHAEWMVCPPGTDLQAQAQQPGPPPCVSYGWVAQHQTPPASDPSVGMETSITRGSVQGTLYTEAGMGAGITAVFPSGGGFVYLTADGDSDAAMYAFQHMLTSLRFQ